MLKVDASPQSQFKKNSRATVSLRAENRQRNVELSKFSDVLKSEEFY